MKQSVHCLAWLRPVYHGPVLKRRRLYAPPRASIVTRPALASASRRSYATEAPDFGGAFDIDRSVERATDEADVVIVGGGPSGLSAAIRLKQLAAERGKEVRVIVLEKGAEAGSHILSGAVIEPRSLAQLFPDWKERGAPLNQPALKDRMRWLTAKSSFPMPHPPQMNNKGNYIVSLSKVTRWLAEQAEELGVEIYPGFAGSKLVPSEDGKGIVGVVTNDIGLDKHRKPKDSFEPGMEFRAKVTLLAEGCHGSLTKQALKRFKLREGKEEQTYGLGVKEVWRVQPEKHEAGTVGHTLGWPLDNKTYGGSWTYHMEDGLVSLGLVVGLDYHNPHLSPYREFQRMKHHPWFASLLEGGECIAYGARTLNEGGYQSIPKLTFPGGALVGDCAGFLNVPKIKGTHTAMGSGIIAAEAAIDALEGQELADMSAYQRAIDESWIMKELRQVRNFRPSFHSSLGNIGGIMYSGIDAYLLRGHAPFTLHHPHSDHEATQPAASTKAIEYPKPDGKLSFDILTSVSRTGTNHEEDQPVHLVLIDGDKARHTRSTVGEYAGLLSNVCPAAVYEYPDAEGAEEDALGKKLVINSQNCVHCKACSIKCQEQDIRWEPPQGGGGPGMLSACRAQAELKTVSSL